MEVEELRRVVDEGCGNRAALEVAVADHGLQEPEVGGDAADAELAQRPVHARDGLLGGRPPGGDLLQQGIVEGRDQGARVGRAAVQADAEAGGAAVGRDAAVVGNELVQRILGGDPALQGVAAQPQILLRRDAAFGLADPGAGGDADLRLYQVDAGDLLGHGVLDLDARIDLDEVEGVRVGIHQELDRAGVLVAGGAGQAHGGVAELAPLGGVQVGRRGRAR